MADGFETDTAKVAELGLTSLASSQALSDALLAAQDAVAAAASSFGNTAAGAALRGSYLSTTGNAARLGGRYVGVLEGDCDRLYQTAFHYQDGDQAAAETLSRTGMTPPVYVEAADGHGAVGA